MTKGTAVERGVTVRLRERIFAVVRAVPRGGVVSYGDVARACGTIPVVVGKALAHSMDGVPWQRVVGQDGTLRTARRGAEFAARQRALLEAEGVAFAEDGRVSEADPGWERGLAALGFAEVCRRGRATAPHKGKAARRAERGRRKNRRRDVARRAGRPAIHAVRWLRGCRVGSRSAKPVRLVDGNARGGRPGRAATRSRPVERERPTLWSRRQGRRK